MSASIRLPGLSAAGLALLLTGTCANAYASERNRWGATGELPPIYHHGADDIIVDLGPLRPIKGLAAPAAKAGRTAPDVMGASPGGQTQQPSGQQPSPGVAEAPGPNSIQNGAAAGLPAALSVAPPFAPPLPQLALSPLPIFPETQANVPPEAAQSPAVAPPIVAAEPRPAPPASAPALIAEADKPKDPPPPAAEGPSGQSVVAKSDAGERPAAGAEKTERGDLAGPTEIKIAGRASLWLPAKHVFLPASGAPAAGEQGAVLGETKGARWRATIETLEDGHIKDADAGALDAGAILEEYRHNLAQAREAGASVALAEPISFVEPPHYDASHRLNYCVEGLAAPGQAPRRVACSSFALGREGAIKISVVVSPQDYARLQNAAASLTDVLIFDHNRGYGDAAPSDQTAPYGLADMISVDTPVGAPLEEGPPAAPAAERDIPSLLMILLLKHWRLAVSALAFLSVMLGALSRMRKTRPAAENRQVVKQADAVNSLVHSALEKARSRFSGRAQADAVLSEAEAPKVDAPERKQVSILANAIAGVRARLAKAKPEAPKAAASEPTMKVEAADSVGPEAAAAGAKDTPASALAKLAAAMRKKAPEQPRIEADAVSRVMRATRPLPGAAPAPQAAPEAPSDASSKSAAPSDDFTLVEPGDVEATTAVISARQKAG